jgi:hypothetical protein
MEDSVPDFEQFVDDLRERLGTADAVDASRIHSFKELMSDFPGGVPEQWYWHAYEELEAQGHLEKPDNVSHKASGGDAFGGSRPMGVSTFGRTSPPRDERRGRSAVPCPPGGHALPTAASRGPNMAQTSRNGSA